MKEQEFNNKILALKDAMYRLARSLLGDCDDAEDAVQDTFAKLWRMRDKLTAYDNLNAFIMVVVRNDCLDRLRKNKSRVSVGIENLDKTGKGYYSESETDDLSQIIRNTMKQLPEKQRTVMHLRDI